MKKAISIFLCIVLLFSFSLASSATSWEKRTKSDMSQYTYLKENNHCFVDSNASDLASSMERKETFTVYFGNGYCAYCDRAVPVLNKIAKEYRTNVRYINTCPTLHSEKYSSTQDYEIVKKYLGDNMNTNADGEKTMKFPTVFFIRNGKVVARHERVVDSYTNTFKPLTSAQEKELEEIYRNCFKLELS